MNPLQSRKKLLLAESELNRAQLVQELDIVADDFYSLADRARTFATFASATASLVSILTSLRRKTSVAADEKPSWLATILKSAPLIGTLWSRFRTPQE